jgi:hypothetical protein
MTDTVAEAPKPVRRPPPRRKVTPPAASDVVDVAELAQQNRMLLERLERLERGGTKFIESEPPPKPVMREADPEAVTPFTRKLLAHTHDVPEHGIVDREPAYNVKTRWYLRRDGQYVQLQGDAKNRAMYEDLGFYLLTLAEAADYVKNERPDQVRLEQTRAALINGCRQLVRREAVLSGYRDDMVWDESLARMSIPRLEEEYRNLSRQTSNPDRRLPTAERYRAEQDPNAGLLVGVETGRSVEDLERKLSAPAAQTRTIEVTQKNAHMFS